jgi:hypothetical protein
VVAVSLYEELRTNFSKKEEEEEEEKAPPD